VVAQIDPSLLQGTLLQAKADLANTQASLAAGKANLEKAKAAGVQTKADYERTAELAKEGVMSQQQLDLAKANYDSAVAGVSAAEAQVTQAGAQAQQKQAAVTVAPNQPQLHDDPCADRRHGDRPQCRRRPDRSLPHCRRLHCSPSLRT